MTVRRLVLRLAHFSLVGELRLCRDGLACVVWVAVDLLPHCVAEAGQQDDEECEPHHTGESVPPLVVGDLTADHEQSDRNGNDPGDDQNPDDFHAAPSA
ncbi:MAG TPA: hypothetical protein VGE30_03540 [Candidatus Saccharimonadales bacterium]